MRYTDEEVRQLTSFLREGDAASAVALYQKRYPPRNLRSFPDLQENDIASILAVRPPTLSFLAETDLREMQIAAAHVLCGGNRRRPQEHFSPGFAWQHAMLPRAALSHMFAYVNWSATKESWKRLKLPIVIRVSHSCGPGICEDCSEAGRYLYTKDTVPDFPIAGCQNLSDGCRCTWTVYHVRRSGEIDELINEFSLIPMWKACPLPR